jgi:hypothetical protein
VQIKVQLAGKRCGGNDLPWKVVGDKKKKENILAVERSLIGPFGNDSLL